MEAAVVKKPDTPEPKLCEPCRQQDASAPQSAAGLPVFLQPKLNVNPPADPWEKEADRVAAAAASSSHTCPGCSEGAPCEKCAATRVPRLLVVQPKAPPAGAASPGSNSAAVTAAVRKPAGGSPLPHAVRDRVEPLLGAELSTVRVHTDPKANTVARALGARAITHRSDIWLARGESPVDIALMAHEATHVLQQAAAPHLDVQRDPDPDHPAGTIQIAGPEGVLLPPGMVGLGLGSSRGGVKGPLPAGETRDLNGVRITQTDQHNVDIEFGYSYVRIRSNAGQTYEYYVEPPRSLEKRQSAGELMLVDLTEPRRQAVVRISATVGVHVNRFQDEAEDAPQLAVHERYMSASDVSESGLFPDVRTSWSGDSVILALDETAIKIEAPADRSDINGSNFPDAKFAYWISPLWSGPQFLEKKVTIVASPGVALREGEPGYYNRSYSYGRRLVPEFIRVTHPALVPQQGEPIRADDFIGYRRFRPGDAQQQMLLPSTQESHDDLIAATSFAGVTIVHPETGAKVSVRPVHRDVGSAYAYQVLPAEGGNPAEIRVVTGPGTFVEVAEPVPTRWRQKAGESTPLPPGEHPSWFGTQHGIDYGTGFPDAGLVVDIVEVDTADQVPLQGTPLNVNYLGRHREPDAHTWIDTSDLAQTIGLGAIDLGIGIIPVVGDLIDIGEFFWALGTDHDRWGRPVTTSDKVLMGVGAVIGLIPLIGDVIGKGLRRAGPVAVDIAQAARRFGKSSDELELIVWQVRGVVKGEDAAPIDRAIRAINRGEEIDIDDLNAVNRVLSGLGADELGTAPRIALNIPAGTVVDFEIPGLEDVGRAANWRRGLNAETRAFLDTSPDVARAYEEMDPTVRAILTKCSSFCLPPTPPTQAQQDSIQAFLLVANPSPDESQLIRTFLHKATDLDAAIQQLTDIATPTKLRRFLNRNVDVADAVLLAREAWRVDPAFEVMRQQARTLVRRGMSVDQLSRIMGEAARAGHGGPEFLSQINHLWHITPRPAGTAELLEKLASGGAGFRNSEWALRYLNRERLWTGLEAFEVHDGRLSARVNGATIQFSSWQRFDSEEFISQVVASHASGAGPRRWIFEPGPLGSADDIQAAAAQALEDALRRGDPRLTREMVDSISDGLRNMIDVPSARKFVQLDAQRVRSVLGSLESQYEVLQRLPLDELSLQRVIAKGPDVNAMKGQLLEELMAVSVRRSLETPAGRRALGVARRQGELVFIEGHRIADAAGRQLTDGIIAIRRGDRLEILTILEAKSGGGSAQGLARSVQTVRSMAKKDKLELFNYIRDEAPEALRDYLSAHHPDVRALFRWNASEGRLIARGSPAQRLAAIEGISDDVLIEVGTATEFRRSAEGWIKTSEVGGQVRRDVERIHDAFGLGAAGRRRGTTILIDGAETEVTLSPRRVEFRGVVPQDVDTDFIDQSLRGLGYRFEAQSMAIDQNELVDLTNALNMQLRPRQP